MKNKVTIVVPCKNEENYIKHLLQSLSKQRGIGKTKIYIADASTDNTRQVIQKHKGDLNVSIIKGGPVSQAKNNGASRTKTPYILFIDADVRFFDDYQIQNAINTLEEKDLDLVGANVRCYDNDIRASIGFTIFNIINNIMKYKSPFAVGAFMLTRKDKFDEYGGFPDKYATSEDYFLSRQYDPQRFAIEGQFGQDSRRFKKMGYFGMAYYLIKNYINRDNEEHWNKLDGSRYWSEE